MNKRLDCIAFHEAGHAVAHILAGIPFKYVTILEDKEKDEHGVLSLGHVMDDKPKTVEEWDKYSLLDPKEFDIFFKDDFIKLSGFVAELLYKGRASYKGSKGDFRHWAGTSLNKLPEKLSSKYQSFLLEYTFNVLNDKTTWSNIVAVTLALIDKDTLSYKEVCDIIKKDLKNPVLKMAVKKYGL